MFCDREEVEIVRLRSSEGLLWSTASVGEERVCVQETKPNACRRGRDVRSGGQYRVTQVTGFARLVDILLGSVLGAPSGCAAAVGGVAPLDSRFSGGARVVWLAHEASMSAAME